MIAIATLKTAGSTEHAIANFHDRERLRERTVAAFAEARTAAKSGACSSS